jgi:hypothetical protein
MKPDTTPTAPTHDAPDLSAHTLLLRESDQATQPLVQEQSSQQRSVLAMFFSSAIEAPVTCESFRKCAHNGGAQRHCEPLLAWASQAEALARVLQ